MDNRRMSGIIIISTVAGVYRGASGIPLNGRLDLSPDPITVDARNLIPDPLPDSGEGISWESTISGFPKQPQNGTGAEKKG